MSVSVQDIEKLIGDMQSEVERLKKKYARPAERLPELMHTFKSHIDTAMFEPCDYSNVRLYNIACSSIVDEMEILFKDITFQLSGEDSGMKHTSFKIAQSIEENLKVLSEQVERGTL